MSNPGVQSAWPTFTDGPSGVSPGADDCNRWSAGIDTLSGRPKGRWLRYDLSLDPDNQWHNCQVIGAQYDYDFQGGFLCPGAHSAPTVPQADFTINTNGIYRLAVRERLAGPVNGDHSLQVVDQNGLAYMEHTITIVPEHVMTNYCVTETFLYAGTILNFQHKYDSFGDNRALTLYTTNPVPEITISMVGEITTHA